LHWIWDILVGIHSKSCMPANSPFLTKFEGPDRSEAVKSNINAILRQLVLRSQLHTFERGSMMLSTPFCEHLKSIEDRRSEPVYHFSQMEPKLLPHPPHSTNHFAPSPISLLRPLEFGWWVLVPGSHLIILIWDLAEIPTQLLRPTPRSGLSYSNLGREHIIILQYIARIGFKESDWFLTYLCKFQRTG
jgi:hypothetical protein